MFEQTPDAQRVNPTEKPEAASPQLHLALFDLAQRAFVSARFHTPALLEDAAPSDRATVSRRIETFHTRHSDRYELPALKNIGLIPTENSDSFAAAVQPVYGESIDFRKFSLKRYDLTGFYSHIQARNESGNGTEHTALIAAAFDHIPELRRFK